MQVAIQVDISKALAKFVDVKEAFSSRHVNLALARTINRATASGVTYASRDIRDTYKIKKADIDRKIGRRKAQAAKPIGAISTYGTPISLNYFRPKQNKKGVAVTIKGKRKQIDHAFLATMPPRSRDGTRLHGPGKQGVFMRGTGYDLENGYKYKPGGRLPITRLITVSEGVMFGNPKVLDITQDRIEDMFTDRMVHEVGFILSKL